uniref:Putative secreted protein n=1 Tax=Anopheles darlingi TaxID=43151 RepID=A0A2M4DCG2_ANODA
MLLLLLLQQPLALVVLWSRQSRHGGQRCPYRTYTGAQLRWHDVDWTAHVAGRWLRGAHDGTHRARWHQHRGGCV